MDFSPHRRPDFRTRIADYRQRQDSIFTRDITFKIEKGIEILYNKQILKFGATYNKDNRSNLFVTVFARDPASKEVAADTCTLIPANALYGHPAPKIESDIEHFNGQRCTRRLQLSFYTVTNLWREDSLYRDYACPQTDLP